ncbi:MAG: response regulator transcription factor [Blastocatellia bacterium]
MPDNLELERPLVLVVDDEPQILRVMRTVLPPRGYDVNVASNGEEALEQIRKIAPDLILLDLVMPDMSGLEVCRRVREFSAVPIVVLSAKGSEKDKVAALDLGADDYVTKPPAMEELLARMRAVLRRQSATGNAPSSITVGEVTLFPDEHRVTATGKEVRLTPKEFDVLKQLMSNAGKIVTHRKLLQAVWGWQSTDQTEYLRVIVNQLRKKLEPQPDHPRYILTEPWVGYRFSTAESAVEAEREKD